MSNSVAVDTSVLLDVRHLASIMKCSLRHVYRLSNAGKMPAPVKLGSLVRWRRTEIEQWIADGCPRRKEACND